jgi:enamine deaminase RidA (YjgF/YER057c/UK114 family)
MRRELIIPKKLTPLYTQRKYAPGVRVGNWLFVSGMLGRDEQLNIIADPAAQFAQMFENMGEVLRAGGSSFAEIVDMTAYFVRFAEDFATFQRVKDRYIPGDFPAMTAIGVAALSTPGLLVEVKCTALVQT